jgi:uncharacterized protein (TIGR03435 family)
MNEMLRALLADRFNLRTHIEHRPMQVYALTPVDPEHPAAKLHPSKTTDCAAAQNDADRRCGVRRVWAVGITAVGLTLDEFAGVLSGRGSLIGLDRPVDNRTGIAGRFDFDIADQVPPPDLRGVAPNTVFGTAAQGASLLTMLKEQLGIVLRSIPGQRDVLVIDQAARPQPD